MRNDHDCKMILSPYGHSAKYLAVVPYYTLVTLWHILVNKLVNLTPQSKNPCRKLRVSAFQWYKGRGVADRVFLSKYASVQKGWGCVFSGFWGDLELRPLFWKRQNMRWFLCKVYREKILASFQNSEDSTISIEQWLLPTTMSKLSLGCPGTTYVHTYVWNKYSQSCEPSFFKGHQMPKFWHLTMPIRRYWQID